MKITVKALDAGNAEIDLPEEVTTRELTVYFRGWFTSRFDSKWLPLLR